MEAIARAHSYANEHHLPVKAGSGASYYIGGKEVTAIIRTNTDFGTASFIIDDRDVQNRKAPVFRVESGKQPMELEGLISLGKNQKKIEASLPGPCLISVTDSHVKHYIRFGLNQNYGSSKTDIFVVDREGHVDMDAPIIWDFEQMTDVLALPIDEDTLSIKGGHFTTIANQGESRYNYYSRNIDIRRSNVLIDGLKHSITGELDHGAPYGGFLHIRDCAYVTVQNAVLTGHRTYQTIGSAGKPVSMGSYDILVNRSINVTFNNCSQSNDINDKRYWGIIASNYSKNLIYDRCTFSRFDAHMGVANASIRNSVLGHMGINAIGSGKFLVENSTIRGGSMINLRSDYGSTWEGEIMILNCTFIPQGGKRSSAKLINGYNSGMHDFGYTCYMPETITIKNLHIDDSNHPEDYNGPSIFADFNPEMTDESYQEDFPYILTKKVILRNVSTASGRDLRLSDNPFMFRDVEIKNQ